MVSLHPTTVYDYGFVVIEGRSFFFFFTIAFMEFIFERLRHKNPDGSLQIMYTIHGTISFPHPLPPSPPPVLCVSLAWSYFVIHQVKRIFRKLNWPILTGIKDLNLFVLGTVPLIMSNSWVISFSLRLTSVAWFDFRIFMESCKYQEGYCASSLTIGFS